MSNRGGSPSPSRPWYDVRPTPSVEIAVADVIEPLGSGDFLVPANSNTCWFRLPVYGGRVHVVCVPLSGNLSDAGVYQIDVDDLYSTPGVFTFEGGGDFGTADFACTLNGRGLTIEVTNWPACAAVVTCEGKFVARLLFGSSSQRETLSSLPVPYCGIDADGYDCMLDVEEGAVYLTCLPESYYGVRGFNLAENASIAPFVDGGDAHSGVDCTKVGGLYGIDVTIPDISFDDCYLFNAGFWLYVLEV